MSEAHDWLIDEGTRNGKTLASFVRYCLDHPNERFWQALRNWSGMVVVYAVREADTKQHLFDLDEGNTRPGEYSYRDTFNWEGRDG